MGQNKLYDSIFGSSPAIRQAERERENSFQGWLDSRKQALEQQRTDDVKMARFHALGNVLTTMVQPLGWYAGGNGVTTAVKPVDNRQYLDAFNRAVKANDDLRNIGTLEGEYQFKLADEKYRRAIAMEEDARKRAIAYDDFKAKQDYQLQNQEKLLAQRHQNTMAEIEKRGDYNMSLAELKGKYRISGRNNVPLSDKMMSAEWTSYQKYKSTWQSRRDAGIEQGPLLTFPEYAAMSGYSVSLVPGGGNAAPTGGGSSGTVNTSGSVTGSGSGSGSSASKTPPSKANKNGSSGSGAGSKTPPSKRNK